MFTVTGVNSCGYSYNLLQLSAVSVSVRKINFIFFCVKCQHQHQHDLQVLLHVHSTTVVLYVVQVCTCLGVLPPLPLPTLGTTNKCAPCAFPKQSVATFRNRNLLLDSFPPSQDRCHHRICRSRGFLSHRRGFFCFCFFEH